MSLLKTLVEAYKNKGSLRMFANSLTGGAANAGFYEAVTDHGNESSSDAWRRRALDFVMGAGGSLAGMTANRSKGNRGAMHDAAGLSKGTVTALATTPFKNLALSSTAAMNNLPLNEYLEESRRANDLAEVALHKPNGSQGMSLGSKLLLGAAGLATVGGGGYLLNKLIDSNNKSDAAMTSALAHSLSNKHLDGKGAPTGSGGRVRITLPTQREGDAETVVDLPMEQVALSKTILQNIGRDTRRRLRAGGVERTRRRAAKPEKEEVIDV